MSKMKASVFEEGADTDTDAKTRAPLLTVLGASSEGAGKGKSLRSRRPSTRYALVEWADGEFSIETKKDLRDYYWDRTTVICDDQQYKVLAKMYILAQGGDDE